MRISRDRDDALGFIDIADESMNIRPRDVSDDFHVAALNPRFFNLAVSEFKFARLTARTRAIDAEVTGVRRAGSLPTFAAYE